MKIATTCGAIVRNHSGQILIMLRSASDSRRPVSWDLPGGHVEPGESLEAGLRRELIEETGIAIGAAAPKLLCTHTATFDETVSVNWLFFDVPVASPDVVLSSEHSEFAWVSIETAIERIDYEPKLRALQTIHARQLLTE